MSYEISVPTPFNDISELAESFHSRVDEERLMLPCGEMVPEGEWVQFAVTLADGSAALQGQGRCTGSFDNGEDRAPEHRFDVVMDSLQLEEMARIYFERILQVRAAYAGDEPQTGETQVPEAAAVAVAEEAAAPEAHAGYEDPAHAGAEAYADPEAGAYEEAPEAVGESPGDFDAPDDGTQVAEMEMTPSQAEAYAEPAAEAAYEDPHAAPVSGADAYETASEFDGEDTRAAAFEDIAAEPAAEPVYDAAGDAALEIDEAVPVDEAFAVDAGAVEDVPIDADELPSEELDSGLIEEAEFDAAEQVPAEAPALAVPTESRIYELPAPQAPGALPSPHAQEAVLTRRLLHATWSPQPEARPERGASTGYFEYAAGAGLPQPASPPRPELDPSQRVAPAPQPGDAYAAPAAPEAAPAYDEASAGYEDGVGDAAAYAEQEGYAEASDAEAAPVEAEAYAVSEEETAYDHPAYDESTGGFAEGDGAEALEVEVGHDAVEHGHDAVEHGHDAVEHGHDAVEGSAEAYGDPSGAEAEAYPAVEATADGGHDAYAPGGYDEMQTMDADAATRQVDVSGLPDDIPLGEETLQVEIPEEESG